MTSPRLHASLLHAERDIALATVDRVFVVIFRVETTVPGVRKLEQEFTRFAATKPDGVALLTIVEEGAPLPEPEARDALAAFMRSQSGVIRMSAVAFEGTGFRSAAVRGVVTGLAILARQPFPHRVFSKIEDAAAWFASQQPSGWHLDGAELWSAVSRLRAGYRAQANSDPPPVD